MPFGRQLDNLTGILIYKFAEPLEPNQFLLEARETRIEAARIGQHENPRPRYHLILGAGAGTPGLAEVIAIDAESDEGHDLGTDAFDLPRQDRFALDDLLARQLRGRARGARTETRHRHAELDQPPVIIGGQRKWNQFGLVQKTPKWISGAGKMMPDLFGSEARINPHEQDPRMGHENIAQGHAGKLAALARMLKHSTDCVRS
jgi:hypothetical protein